MEKLRFMTPPTAAVEVVCGVDATATFSPAARAPKPKAPPMAPMSAAPVAFTFFFVSGPGVLMVVIVVGVTLPARDTSSPRGPPTPLVPVVGVEGLGVSPLAKFHAAARAPHN